MLMVYLASMKEQKMRKNQQTPQISTPKVATGECRMGEFEYCRIPTIIFL
jgi:hypothetical protein